MEPPFAPVFFIEQLAADSFPETSTSTWLHAVRPTEPRIPGKRGTQSFSRCLPLNDCVFVWTAAASLEGGMKTRSGGQLEGCSPGWTGHPEIHREKRKASWRPNTTVTQTPTSHRSETLRVWAGVSTGTSARDGRTGVWPGSRLSKAGRRDPPPLVSAEPVMVRANSWRGLLMWP